MEPRINNTDKNERTITYQEDGKLTMTVRASDPVTFNQITTINSSIKELEQKFTRMEDQIGLEHLKANHEFSDIKTNLKNAVNDLQLQDRNIKYGMNKRCDEISDIVKTQGQGLANTNKYVDILAEVHNRSVTYYKLKLHKVNIKLKDMATILRWLVYLIIILLAVLIGMVAAIVVYM